MKVILALGNPGARYAGTRHNIGWMVADALAERLGAGFAPGPGNYYEARGRSGDADVVIVKPTTYMNNSGLAARQILERFDTSPEEMLVLVDELQFPVGRVQLKPAGSSAGHNGTESVIVHLATERFPRLRCGIGDGFAKGTMAEHVLSPFSPDESEALERMIVEARDATLAWITEGTQRAMNRVNSRRTTTEGADGSEPQARESADTAAPSRHDDRPDDTRT